MNSESDLLRHIAARSADLHGRGPIELGPGDDAAVLRFGGERLLLTVDQLVEGVHYLPDATSIDLIARKAVARSVSDIAAMGGSTIAGLATGALRAGFEQGDELFDAMARWARRWECPLIGGDIARVHGPTTLTVTVIGRAHPVRGPVLRSGARPGDGVYITGALGGSFASGRHLTFEPRLGEARWLCDQLGDRLHAMMDLSDGLGRDGARIASASGVRLEIEPQKIPLHPEVRSWMHGVSDGEDYELLFAAAGDVPSCAPSGVPINRIGAVVEGEGCVMLPASKPAIDASEMGWNHGG